MRTDTARRRLEDQLGQLDADVETETADREPVDRLQVTDFGDGGANAAGQMDENLTLGTLRRRRQQTVAALRRIDDGTFGTCRTCGAEIDDERLDIRPETEFCRDHAEGTESL